MLNLAEAPREIVEGLVLWAFGFYIGHRHLKRPMEAHHRELLAHHEAHRDALERLEGKQ